MENASQYTYKEMIEPGELGDREAEIRLTVRQVACLQFILGLAVEHGLGIMALHSLASSLGPEIASLLDLEFDRAQARVGLYMARVLDESADFAARASLRLAELDQRATDLRNARGD